MAKKVGCNDPYPVPPEALMDMYRDYDYFVQKYRYMEDIETDINLHEVTDDGIKTHITRVAKADLPKAVRKVLGDTKLDQRETWHRDGDGWSADLVVDSPGKPVSATGRMKITPTDTGSQWWVEIEISSGAPLVGGTVEKVVSGEFQAALEKEYAFNKQWLKDHPPA